MIKSQNDYGDPTVVKQSFFDSKDELYLNHEIMEEKLNHPIIREIDRECGFCRSDKHFALAVELMAGVDRGLYNEKNMEEIELAINYCLGSVEPEYFKSIHQEDESQKIEEPSLEQ